MAGNHIDVHITAENEEFVRRMEEIIREIQRAEDEANGARSSFSGMGDNLFGGFLGGLAKAELAAQGLIGILTTIKDLAGSIVMPGFDFAKDMESSQVGMTGILMSMGQINGAAIDFNTAMDMSSRMMSKLNMDAIRTAASTQDLVTTFQGLLAPGLGAGMNLEQIREYTTVGVNAAKAMHLGSAQFIQELRDLTQGGITSASSTIATSLGLRDEDIEKAKNSAEGLFAFLMERMSGYGEAAKAYPSTFEGLFDQIGEYATLASAKITDLFGPEIKEISKDIADEFGQVNEETGQFEVNPEILAFVEDLGEVYIWLLEVYDATVNWWAQLSDTLVMESIIGLCEDLWSIVKELYHIVIKAISAFRGFFTYIGNNTVIVTLINNVRSLANELKYLLKLVGIGWDSIDTAYETANNEAHPDVVKSNKAQEARDRMYYNSIGDMAWGQTQQGNTDKSSQVTSKYKKDNTDAAKKAAKERSKAEQEILKQALQLLKTNLDAQLELHKDHLEKMELLYKQNQLSVTDIENDRAQKDVEDAQSHVDELTAAIEQVNGTFYDDENKRSEQLQKYNAELGKWTKKLGDANAALQDLANVSAVYGDQLQSWIDQENRKNAANPQSTGQTQGKVYDANNPMPENVPLNAYGSTEQWLMHYYTSHNVPRDVSAALVGNQRYESAGFDPNAVSGDGYGSIGLTQWTFDRKAGPNGLYKFGEQNGLDMGDIRNQAAFTLEELFKQGYMERIKQGLSEGMTPEKAVRVYYEGPDPSVANDSKRQEYTDEAINNFDESVTAAAAAATDAGEKLYSMSTELEGEGTTWTRQAGVNMEDLSPRAKFMWNNMAGWWSEHYGRPLVASSGYRDDGEHTGDAIDFRGYKDRWDDWNDDLLASSIEVRQAMRDYIQNVLHGGAADEYAHTEYGGWHLHANASGKSWTDLTDNVGKGYYGGVSPDELIQQQQQRSQMPGYTAKTKQSLDLKNELLKIKKEAEEAHQKVQEIYGGGYAEQKTLSVINYKDKLDKAKANAKLVPGEYQDLQKLLEEELKGIDLKKYKNGIELAIKDLQYEGNLMGYKISDGFYSMNDAVNKYYQHVYGAATESNKSMQGYITGLEELMAYYQREGNMKGYWEVKDEMDKVQDSLNKVIKGWITHLTDLSAWKSNMVDANSSMSTMQKDAAKKQLETDKNRQTADAQRSQLKNDIQMANGILSDIVRLTEDINQTTDADQKSELEMRLALKQNQYQELHLLTIPDLERQIAYNNELSRTPTLLEKVRQSAKQAFEDGLVTFLTDGINQATSLGDALLELASSILKSIQKMFAEKITQDLMDQWFPSTDNTKLNTGYNMNFGYSGNVLDGFTKTDAQDGYDPSFGYSGDIVTGFDSQVGQIGGSLGQASSSMATFLSSFGMQSTDFVNAVNDFASQVLTSLQSASTTIRSATTSASSASTGYDMSFGIDTSAVPQRAEGGLMTGPGTDTSDNILSRLSPGEFVVRAAAVRKYGVNVLKRINEGRWGNMTVNVPRFAGGGLVGDAGAAVAEKFGLTAAAPAISNHTSVNNYIDGHKVFDAYGKEFVRTEIRQQNIKEAKRNSLINKRMR